MRSRLASTAGFRRDQSRRRRPRAGRGTPLTATTHGSITFSLASAETGDTFSAAAIRRHPDKHGIAGNRPQEKA